MVLPHQRRKSRSPPGPHPNALLYLLSCCSECRAVVNLFFPLPDARSAERVDALLTRPGLRIERIVSQGQASPPGFWYDQQEAEWVLLLGGAARLRFADEPDARLLGPGDWLEIAPHRRHRVDWTDPEVSTIWLAVFCP
jgi:cupin 2 domain-containing protein